MAMTDVVTTPATAFQAAGVATESRVVESASLTRSLWYRQRALITAVSIFSCLTMGMLSPAWISEGSWTAFHINNVAWTVFGMAIAVRLWASAYIGGRKSLAVVCEGPYSVCRNPLYWGTFLILVSMALFLKSGMFVVGMILPIALYLWGVVPAEEAVLRERLGFDYRAYCERVPRWWPSWKLYVASPVCQLQTEGIGKEVWRILGWCWLPFCAMLVCRLRMEPWWPQLFRLP